MTNVICSSPTDDRARGLDRPMIPVDPSTLERLEVFTASFADCFRRRDQARWLGVYLQGLLSRCSRKNTESLARHVTLPPGLRVEDAAQALQNFVNQSPWDEAKLWRRYRQWVLRQFDDPAGTLVVADVAFPKKGERSVGVHRQMGGELGKKINCQLGVSVSHVSQAGCFPLALRLYLPRPWLADEGRLEALGIPPEHRTGKSKRQIALDLLAELRAAGFSGKVLVANTAYGLSQEFRDGLQEQGWSYLVGVDEELLVTVSNSETLSIRDLAQREPLDSHPGIAERFRRLPVWLDKGAAADPGSEPYDLFLVRQPEGDWSHVLGKGKGTLAEFDALSMWGGLRRVEEGFARLKENFGLDHFEGRSWRGFHHHACLVALAHGFRIAEQTQT